MDKDTWLVVLVAMVLAFGSVTYATLSTSASGSRTCQVAKQIAAIQLATAQEARPRTEAFERESKDRFGLSQNRFDQLIRETQERQIQRASELRALAREAC